MDIVIRGREDKVKKFLKTNSLFMKRNNIKVIEPEKEKTDIPKPKKEIIHQNEETEIIEPKKRGRKPSNLNNK